MCFLLLLPFTNLTVKKMKDDEGKELGQNRQQKATQSWKLENDEDDIAEPKMQKLEYLESSRSTRSKQSYSAESRKGQELKTPGALKGGPNSGVKTYRTGILSEKLLATHGQLFPIGLWDTPIPLGLEMEP